MAFDIELIRKVYEQLPGKVTAARTVVGRPLTLAEKTLYSHAYDATARAYARGKDYVNFAPDRVAMQDATAQMALLQFMSCGLGSTAVPASIHCDHMIVVRDTLVGILLRGCWIQRIRLGRFSAI